MGKGIEEPHTFSEAVLCDRVVAASQFLIAISATGTADDVENGVRCARCVASDKVGQGLDRDVSPLVGLDPADELHDLFVPEAESLSCLDSIPWMEDIVVNSRRRNTEPLRGCTVVFEEVVELVGCRRDDAVTPRDDLLFRKKPVRARRAFIVRPGGIFDLAERMERVSERYAKRVLQPHSTTTGQPVVAVYDVENAPA